MRQAIPARIRELVTQRASYRCEYCLFHEDDLFFSFEIDHIVSLKHGGSNEVDNLAYSCPHCNNHKGSDLTTILDDYDDVVRLFNPRIHDWHAHFQVFDGEILPQTRIGQATAKLLRFNQADLVILRRLLMQAGRYP